MGMVFIKTVTTIFESLFWYVESVMIIWTGLATRTQFLLLCSKPGNQYVLVVLDMYYSGILSVSITQM